MPDVNPFVYSRPVAPEDVLDREPEIRQLLSAVEGVSEVDAEMVLRPPWTPEMMSEEAKAALGFF